MKWVKDALKNEMGLGCPRNKMDQGSPWCYMNWPSRNTEQCKLKERITHEIGMADTSAYKPRSGTVNKGKQNHSRNNAVAW